MKSNYVNSLQIRNLKNYLKEIKSYPFLSVDQEKEIFKAIKNGNITERDKLITSNLKFVVAVARRYSCSNIPINDLINDGNIGLIKSIEKFDPDKGVRFLTFAYLYIRGSILASIYDNYSLIRIPRHQWLLNANSDSTELPEDLDSQSESDTFQPESKKTNLKQVYLSYDLSAFQELFVDEPDTTGGCNPEEYDTRINKLVFLIVAKLSYKEQYIIKATFGLEGNPEITYEKLGAKLGISRERVRVIRKKAIAKLRIMLEYLEVDDFFND